MTTLTISNDTRANITSTGAYFEHNGLTYRTTNETGNYINYQNESWNDSSFKVQARLISKER